MDDPRSLLLVLLAVFGSGGGAWAAVKTSLRIHVEYLNKDIDEAKAAAEKAHSHADKAHDRITGLIMQGNK